MAAQNPHAPTKPARDEWGVYDPEQAGIAAVVARLDARERKTAAAPAPPVIDIDTSQSAPRAAIRPTLKDAQ